MEKKEWFTPELIILTKSTPGEDILTVCKSVNHAVAMKDGSDATGQLCKVAKGQCGGCLSSGGRGS